MRRTKKSFRLCAVAAVPLTFGMACASPLPVSVAFTSFVMGPGPEVGVAWDGTEINAQPWEDLEDLEDRDLAGVLDLMDGWTETLPAPDLVVTSVYGDRVETVEGRGFWMETDDDVLSGSVDEDSDLVVSFARAATPDDPFAEIAYSWFYYEGCDDFTLLDDASQATGWSVLYVEAWCYQPTPH